MQILAHFPSAHPVRPAISGTCSCELSGDQNQRSVKPGPLFGHRALPRLFRRLVLLLLHAAVKCNNLIALKVQRHHQIAQEAAEMEFGAA
jgi:hypothetical protein